MNEVVQNQTPAKAHNKLGLISFGLAVFGVVVSLILFIVIFVPETGTYAEQKANQIFFTFAFIIAPVFHLIGLIFGAVDFFKINSKKLFPVLGMIFNVLPFLFAIVVWILILFVGSIVAVSGGD